METPLSYDLPWRKGLKLSKGETKGHQICLGSLGCVYIYVYIHTLFASFIYSSIHSFVYMYVI